ncbi:DUF6630 family protein [Verminephrobacter eiseniae]|uniref:Uncharacterized protein n=2 Tax=Verminephrobacter eiseniae TaxID=364317 RepID=A1WEI9_VEREI|nr:PoNe immunity protein domain-containing protein [Verminephrobacter eiseniae]ABM56046.1 hypothetical protein Veis_0255 [Verminephrobacter eiseniae EF01-2]MCW5286418.1 DUF1911 domain-containing protein [Verminephrobacter eiseniae]MCW5304717.1 DUF1911 domain-containing protein [Verminephrobacter eiseniae]MCW8192449.1 DUF1911 domain-containing protein [Verminephrobacter eiseniae]
MRDPDGKLETYEGKIEFCIRRLKQLSKNEDKEIFTRWHNTLSTFPRVIEYMLFRYGRGDPLADIWSYFEKDGWPFYQRVVVHAKQLPPLSPDKDQERPSIGLFIGARSARTVNFFLAFLLCMDESSERIINHRNWLFMDPPCPLVDVMLKSFIPNHRGVPNYKYNKYRQWWTFPLVNALAQPPEQRPAALAAHMNNWYRLMRPLGWKPNRDPALEKDGLFCDFAFEVALAVCAYDIDDSSFRDHPHYPRDLVDHYRQHIRHTRDAWRAEGLGAGIELPPPVPPKRVDLAKSKRKNFARWVELACDGYDDAVESVLETTGKPRKIQDFFQLLEALQDVGHAIHADGKDSDTLDSQAADLADARGIGPFEAPDSDPPQGGARCTAILRALHAWAAPRGYQLIDLDDQDDAWHAVLVKTEYHDEFLALSQALGLRTRKPQQAYLD